MNKQISSIILSILVGLGLGYLIFGVMADSDDSAMNTDSNTSQMQETSMTPTAMHSEIEVDSSLPIPTVVATATPDTKDGYNLKIEVTNFTFTPELAGMANEPNTGHAHIYINDEKLGRIYGDWFYLPSKYLKDGDNKVEITLNANDHSDWLVGGEHIGSIVTIKK